MNPVRAKLLEERLRGTEVGSYTIRALLGAGKTAAVFTASRGDETVALKLFDPEFVEEIGLDSQLRSIERQLRLRDHPHDNIVRIFDGGYDKSAGYLFLSMEHLPATPLTLALDTIPVQSINSIVMQLVAAARHLENLQLSHRDIKPDNINYNARESTVKLLDFGVIRPFGEPNDTDAGGILRFIGTLQYSSPEFLLRTEEQNERGWRAITIYQIGAVMHDLIMRRPIFAKDQYPFARLSNAVQYSMPEITNDDIDPGVINLAMSCLVKDPETRLRLVSWDTFESVLTPSGQGVSSRVRVLARAQLVKGQREATGISSVANAEKVARRLRENICDFLRSQAREIRAQTLGFPPITSSCDPKRMRVQFTISESHDFAVVTRISVSVFVEVIDLGSSVIRLSSKAYLDASPIAVSAENSDELFTGPYDQAVVARFFEERLFTYIDSAQQRRSAAEDGVDRLVVGAE
jgi:serine/threonine protein kinase